MKNAEMFLLFLSYFFSSYLVHHFFFLSSWRPLGAGWLSGNGERLPAEKLWVRSLFTAAFPKEKWRCLLRLVQCWAYPPGFEPGSACLEYSDINRTQWRRGRLTHGVLGSVYKRINVAHTPKFVSPPFYPPFAVPFIIFYDPTSSSKCLILLFFPPFLRLSISSTRVPLPLYFLSPHLIFF